jgi:neutral ceramidase
MLAGFAEIDITPPPGEELTGYGYFLERHAQGTLDPLFGRAVALSDGEARAVLVQLDLLGLPRWLVEEVRARAERELGLPPAHLMLHCTHTHSGPATMPLYGCGTPSEQFPAALIPQVLTLVSQALADLKPVTASERFEGDFPDGFAGNRVGLPDLDTRVRGVRFQVAAGAPILLFSYACHPVVLGINREYSADYPAYAIRELNAYGLRALFLNGPCGDVDPLSNRYRWGAGTQETLRLYGHDLAGVVRRALLQATEAPASPLRACSRRIPLPMAMPDAAAVLEASLAKARAAAQRHPEDGPRQVDVMWHERMLELYAAGTLDDAMRAEVQAIACGGMVFVGLSGEIFTRLGQMIRAGAPGHHVLVANTCNAVLGYISTHEDVEAGGYASLGSCKLYGMPLPTPDAGERWAAEGAGMLRELLA